ncbi:unnamed protein product, partial [Heterosigma akashiwo]
REPVLQHHDHHLDRLRGHHAHDRGRALGVRADHVPGQRGVGVRDRQRLGHRGHHGPGRHPAQPDHGPPQPVRARAARAARAGREAAGLLQLLARPGAHAEQPRAHRRDEPRAQEGGGGQEPAVGQARALVPARAQLRPGDRPGAAHAGLGLHGERGAALPGHA